MFSSSRFEFSFFFGGVLPESTIEPIGHSKTCPCDHFSMTPFTPCALAAHRRAKLGVGRLAGPSLIRGRWGKEVGVGGGGRELHRPSGRSDDDDDDHGDDADVDDDDDDNPVGEDDDDDDGDPDDDDDDDDDDADAHADSDDVDDAADDDEHEHLMNGNVAGE